MSFHADLILPAENWASTISFYELICPLHVTSDLFINLFHLPSTVQQSVRLSFLLSDALNVWKIMIKIFFWLHCGHTHTHPKIMIAKLKIQPNKIKKTKLID